MIKYLNNDDELKDIIKKDLWLVEFSATWCGPCRMLEPVLEQLTAYNILKIDIDEEREITDSFNIMSVPTILIFKDGQEINKIIGYHTKEEIEQIIKTLK